MSTKSSDTSPSVFYFMKNLSSLYFSPTKFFSRLDLLKSKVALFFVTYALGMMSTMEHIDICFLKGSVKDALSLRMMYLISHWLCYWKVVLVVGLILGLVHWFVGGWWFNLRIKWSGAKEVNKLHGRIIYVYSFFIVVLPMVLAALFMTFFFKNYMTTYDFFVTTYESNPTSLAVISSIFIIPLFWSICVSYKAVVSCFKVDKWKAAFWFLTFPIIFYTAELVVFYLLWMHHLN